MIFFFFFGCRDPGYFSNIYLLKPHASSCILHYLIQNVSLNYLNNFLTNSLWQKHFKGALGHFIVTSVIAKDLFVLKIPDLAILHVTRLIKQEHVKEHSISLDIPPRSGWFIERKSNNFIRKIIFLSFILELFSVLWFFICSALTVFELSDKWTTFLGSLLHILFSWFRIAW